MQTHISRRGYPKQLKENNRCHVAVMNSFEKTHGVFDTISTQMMERQRRKCYSTTSLPDGMHQNRQCNHVPVTLCQAVSRVNHHFRAMDLELYDILNLRPEQSGPNVLCVMRKCV